MYNVLLDLHNILRWVVLIIAIAAAGKALMGWLGKQTWTKIDDQLGLFFTIGMDVQLLFGLILYIFFSPITQEAFRDFGAAMSDSSLRYFAVEHISIMLLAVILTHVGRATSKRADAPSSKFKRAAIFFTLALVMLLAGTPWFRPLLPF